MYVLLLIPLYPILILYLNIAFYPPLLHTIIFGQPKELLIEAKLVQKTSSKGGIHHYLETTYDNSRIFHLNVTEYEQYKNQQIYLKLSVLEGQLGTYIKEVQPIERIRYNQE